MSKYISQDDFAKMTLGKAIDYDKAYGTQCVDLFKHFIGEIEQIKVGSVCPDSGYAKDIYKCFSRLTQINPYFILVSANKMQDGDWAIWNSGSQSSYQKSHVAMFRYDIDGGYGMFLGQNAGGTVINQKLSYKGLLGALRPKMYIKPEIATLGTPVSRDENIDQIDISVDNLRVRDCANGNILGYIKKGLYNVLNSQINGDYTWYEVESGKWVAYSPDWAVFYAKKVIETPKEEPIIEQPIDTPSEPIFEPVEPSLPIEPHLPIDEPVVEEDKPIDDTVPVKTSILSILIERLIDFIKKLLGGIK